MGNVSNREVLILGGGISGLSLAYFLLQKEPSLQITLLEASDRLGGVIQTHADSELLFERGPRTFLFQPHSPLLQLIREIGLAHELILSSPQKGGRFLWHQGKLRSLSSLIPWRTLPRALLLSSPPIEDESIYSFAARRFSAQVADELFDPLTLGIYAGEIRKLSIRSCFPAMHLWDQRKIPFLDPFRKLFRRLPLFTLQGGMSRLISTLQSRLPIEILFRHPVTRLLSCGERGVQVEAGGVMWEGARVFAALPLSVIQTVTGAFAGVPSRSLWTVNLAYEHVQFPQGYGYLVPTQAQESLLGMIWDSSLFPQQGQRLARATAILRGETKQPVECALEAAQRHLAMRHKPYATDMSYFQNAIPQFEVGYEALKAREQQRLAQQFPRLFLAGNYWQGASIDNCIERSRVLSSL